MMKFTFRWELPTTQWKGGSWLDVRIRISGHSSHLRNRRTDSDHTILMLDFMAGINFKNNFWHFQFAPKRLDDVIPTYNTVLKRRNVWFVNKWRQLNFNISFPRCFLGTKSVWLNINHTKSLPLLPLRLWRHLWTTTFWRQSVLIWYFKLT